jgi:Transposase DDE domain
MILPFAPFDPIPLLLLTVPLESDLLVFLEEAHRFVSAFPSLVALVEGDLDAHGRRKKALRLADAAWREARTAPLPGATSEPAAIDPGRLKLQQGRERTPAYVVLMALLLRGYFAAGFKASEVATMMQESMTLHLFFTNLGLKMPGRSTFTELVNAVTNETRLRILDAQAAHVLGMKLDDFSTMIQDSTHVEGNTTWPTDSRTMVALVARILCAGARLGRLRLPVLQSPRAQRHLEAMITLDREIDLNRGKGERGRARTRRYEKILWRANRVRTILAAAVAEVETALASLDVLPSKKAVAVRVVERLRADVDILAKTILNCETRILAESKVPMAEKILSVSDPDVGFIAKGQREPVIGYKPQIALSGESFITALLLPQGNAADSGQLLPMVDDVMQRTARVPRVLTVDDGYASKANVDAAKARGIKVVSINGSKGRALTARTDWNSDAFADARALRSAAESLIFTLKQGFAFGEVARRGLSAAHAELLEKALAYNLCQVVRKREAAERKRDTEHALASAA